MSAVHGLIEGHLGAAWVAIILSFAVLARSASLFVDGSIGLARRLRIPKLVIGIVLVSLATTAPELSVSLMSALKGKPEMALGNAMGSVICDDGLALGLAGLLTVSVIALDPRILKTSGLFLILVQALLFLFVAFDSTLDRWEGAVLVALFAGYLAILFRQHRQGKFKETADLEAALNTGEAMGKGRMIATFALGLAGIILASEFIVLSASSIARSFNISDAVIAMTLVALGTSIPEVATCVVAARKGEGAMAVGNILGADIMNICWVAGASALANPLTLSRREIGFMFPAMFLIVAVMLILLRIGYSLNRVKGAILLVLYAVYLAVFFMFSPMGQ